MKDLFLAAILSFVVVVAVRGQSLADFDDLDLSDIEESLVRRHLTAELSVEEIMQIILNRRGASKLRAFDDMELSSEETDFVVSQLSLQRSISDIRQMIFRDRELLAENAQSATNERQLAARADDYMRFDPDAIVIPTGSRWQVSQSSDPITDNTVTYLRLPASTGRNSWGDPIWLVLRRDGLKTELYADWNSFLSTESLRVTSRVDSKSPVTRTWSISTNYESVFARDAQSLIAELIGGERFVVRLTPYSESPSTAVFDLTGLKERVMKMEYLHPWYEEYVRVRLSRGVEP